MEAAVSAIIRAARPEFRSQPDKLAFALHAFMLSRGYKLVAVGAEAEGEGADWAADREEVGTQGWNDTPGVYAFRYQPLQGSKGAPVYLKALDVGAGRQLLVHWLVAAPGAAPQSLDLDVGRYTTDAEAPTGAYKNLGELLSKLEGAFGGEGGAAAKGVGTAAAAHGERGGRSVLEEPGPRRPEPGFVAARDDRQPPGVPVGVGADDVVPPGFRPPGYGPGGGLVPGLGEPSRGGGMHVGPGHPMFGPGRLGGAVGGPPDLGSLPPGARWDPIAPPGMRGFRPDDFRQPRPPRPHPDIMQPGPTDVDTDWDMYG